MLKASDAQTKERTSEEWIRRGVLDERESESELSSFNKTGVVLLYAFFSSRGYFDKITRLPSKQKQSSGATALVLRA